jgi:hypothetical protein
MYRQKRANDQIFYLEKKIQSKNFFICLVVLKFLAIGHGWFLDILVVSYTLVVEHVNLFEHFGAIGPHTPSLLL